MRTLKDTKRDLTSWGLFWQRKKAVGGWPSKSTSERCREILETGVFISSDVFLHNNNADDMREPEWITKITDVVNTLNVNEQKALAFRYTQRGHGVNNALANHMSKHEYDYYLKHAHLAVMRLL